MSGIRDEGLSMKAIKVTLETVTPLFLGGADPRGEPELRAASIRGALRFWLRALLGGVIGDKDLDALRKAESAVFGSTDTGASPVVVRIKSHSAKTISFSQLAQWDNTLRNYRRPGIAYLFFSARQTGNEPERYAIRGGTTFELEFTLRLGADADYAFEQAYAALWLLTHLGGLGARSRRGAGSLQVTQVHGNVPNSALPSLEIRASTPEQLQAELQKGLSKLRKSVGGSASVDCPSRFDVLHPNACKIWVVDKKFTSWEAALDAIGQRMQQFRNRRAPDYQNVKNAVQGQPLMQSVKRAAFGLPIVFFFSSLYKQYIQQGMKKDQARTKATGTLEGSEHDRRASPLFIRVTRLADGKYVLVLTLFQAQLLEAGEKLKLKRQGPPTYVNAPDLSLIDDFIQEVRRNIGPCLEVTGW
jgi:CRISPR-associated protein Cmr1